MNRDANKRCSCSALYSPAAWARLRFVGFQLDAVELLELRNCFCGSTISRAWCAKCSAELDDGDVTHRCPSTRPNRAAAL